MIGTRKHSKPLAGLLATLMFVASAFVATITTAAPADAGCTGASMTWGQSIPYWNTCDGDGRMFGNLMDWVTDGYCVTAQHRDGGRIYNAGTACVTMRWSSFGFYDQTGDRTSDHRITNVIDHSHWERQTGY